MGGTVTIFDPQGNKGEVPYANLAAAVKAGGKLAVTVKAPDGTLGEIPADRLPDAAKAGASVVPFKDQENQHPGFWHSLWSDVSGMAQGLTHLNDYDPMTDPKLSQEEKMTQVNKDFADAQEEVKQRTAQYGPTYANVTAPAAGMLGVNVPGMEQSAKEGDTAGVMGHTAAVPAVMAATEGLSEAIPAAVKAAPGAVRGAAKGANTVLAKAPGTVGAAVGAAVGHATGVPYGGEVGAIIGGGVGREVLPKVQIPGEGFGFPNRVAGGPVSAPAYQTPAERLPSAFQPLPKKPPVVPGTVEQPFKSLSELPPQAVHQAVQELGSQAAISAITERANNIAKLGDLLNQATGGDKGQIQPGVPIKNQGGVIMPNAEAPAVLEGHTTVDSSALKSYKYDPKAHEIEIGGNGPGSGYVYGDVSPEQAQSFLKGEFAGQKAGDPPSFGKAWNELRKNSTPVAKIINGKRVAIKPAISEEDQIPNDEWEAGHELETAVEGTRR
jgi:hypothetical protein